MNTRWTEHEVEERRFLYSLVWMLMGSKPIDYMFNFERKQTVCFCFVFFFLIHGLPIAHLIISDKIWK